jgi:hypothetical protein
MPRQRRAPGAPHDQVQAFTKAVAIPNVPIQEAVYCGKKKSQNPTAFGQDPTLFRMILHFFA